MLGYIEGKIISRNADQNQCTVLSGGVGYEISLSKRTAEGLLPNESRAFWIHTHVREDVLVLFGFATETEKQFFRILLSVSGLGPKTALSLLSEHGAEKLSGLIISKEVSEISTAPGVGKKLAERLVLELASKLEKLSWVTQIEKQTIGPKAAPSAKKQLREDLLSALLHLGYQPNQIKTTLDKMFENNETHTLKFETCLKDALKEMSAWTNA